MAITAFGTNDSQTVQYWSAMTMREALKATLFKKFLGKDKTAIIQRFSELEKGAGDTVKFDLLMQMTSAGVRGDERQKDNEEALVYHQDEVKIDQLRNAHAFRNMSQQRTVHDLRQDAMMNLADWWAGTFDSYMFRMLCGDTTLTHGQTGLAPDSDHHHYSGSHTTEATLVSGDEFTLADIDYAKEAAKTLSPPLRPAMIDGEEYFVMVIHPYSVTDLRLNSASATNMKWQDIQQYANVRGLKNPIFSGALGVYSNVILFESNRIYEPSSSVRRNLFLGRQAGVFALGNAYKQINRKKFDSGNLMSWYEESDDYGNENGVAVGSIFGVKKTRFNSKDYGVITVSSYATSHS